MNLQTITVANTPQGQALVLENEKFMEQISNYTGKQMKIDNCFQVADYIEAARRMNITLLPWMDKVYEQARDVELKFLRLFSGMGKSSIFSLIHCYLRHG
jgi:uncharacterized lipoprotein YddW (UPF0748 family)